MAIKYGFYNSVDHDRMYDAEDFSTFMDGLIDNGVLSNIGNKFQVTASGTNVIVGTGKAWFHKTWTYNDAPLTIAAIGASTVNNRIDRLVLEINKTIGIRANTIKWVEGTVAASPVPPTLLRSDDVNQYSLARVYRTKSVNTVTTGNITIDVGSADCPFASNGVFNTDTRKTLEIKRSMSRGNSLGGSFTTEQRAAIRNGTFEGLFLGDYWTYGGIKWRIVDFNYWMGQRGTSAINQLTTNARITDNHVVIVPDDPRSVYGASWRNPPSPGTVASNCGIGSSEGLGGGWADTAKDVIALVYKASLGLFAESRIVRRRPYLPKGMAPNGLYMDRVDAISKWFATPMNESQITGVTSTTTRLIVGSENRQFAYYLLDERNIWPEGVVYPFWLMTQWSVDRANCYHDWERCSTDASTQPGPGGGSPVSHIRGGTHYERPVFGVTGL